jgi:hypothetical protein
MAEEISSERERRGLAGAFALCALAILTLLASHPRDAARSLADVLKDEAHSVLLNGLVHGGFIVTLAALIICFVLLSRRLGRARVPVVIALTAFCIGGGLLIASMIVDGFVTPAIAVRFAQTDSADALMMARTLLIFCGTVIQVLMPMGMLFQSAAMFGWSVVIAKGRGLRRTIGAFGMAAGLIQIVAIAAVPSALMAHVLLAGIALQAIWYLALAALLSSRASLADSATPH